MSLEKQTFIENKFLSVFNDKAFKEILSKEDYAKYINARQTVFFNKGESLFEESRAAAVSYTHLDVYKRQP